MMTQTQPPPAPDGPDLQENHALRYVMGMVLVMLVALVLFGTMAWRMGPPIGDLTRISGLSESDYGWRGQKTGFTQDYFTELSTVDLLAGAGTGEILVFGDSFSATQDGHITWTNTLHANTGRSIDLVDINALADIKTYFQTDAFTVAPPEVVIIEMGERTAFRRAQSLMGNADCSALPAPKPIALRPVTVPRVDWNLRRQFTGFDELISWGALSLRLRLFSAHKTVPVTLARDDLFSSPRADQLLIYHSDIFRHLASQIAPYSGAEAEQATICAIRDVIHAANGKAQVYVMLAPDKRSIYKQWITDPLPEKAVHFLDALPGTLSGHYIDLKPLLLNAAENGVKDVYFPNDTHWSDFGHSLVGSHVSERIGGEH